MISFVCLLCRPVRRLLKLEDHSSLEENLGCLVVSVEITTEEMSPEGLEMVQGVTSTRKTVSTRVLRGQIVTLTVILFVVVAVETAGDGLQVETVE